MFLRPILFACALAASVAAPAMAQVDDDDEIVRLPGQGTTKPEARKPQGTPDRLVPGGGLFLSFDANGDGRITPQELQTGAAEAFLKADANADGALTAFEQINWAESLPTRDDTLANPVRFDPNLDRRVSPEEFHTVIVELAAHYAGSPGGDILIADLKAPKPPIPERDERNEAMLRADRDPYGAPGRH